jgi:hypothetical protein
VKDPEGRHPPEGKGAARQHGRRDPMGAGVAILLMVVGIVGAVAFFVAVMSR